MYTNILSFLQCPTCQSALTSTIHETDDSGEILTATLACSQCARLYPVLYGIADFLGAAQPTTPAQAVNEWRFTAWAYERFWRPFSLTLLAQQPFCYRRELPLLAQFMQPERGGVFLDIACSNGLYARALTRAMRGAAGHVLGIDHSMPMLLEARRRACSAGLQISYARAEAQALPCATNAAAGAAIGGSLNEIGDVSACLSEIQRALIPNGQFVSMSLVQASSTTGQVVQRLLGSGGVVFPSPDALHEAVQAAGFVLDTSKQFGIVLFISAHRVA